MKTVDISNTNTVGAIVGLLTISLLPLALLISYWMNDEKTIFLVVGSILTNATTIVNYQFGSSRGSQKKDETISESVTALATSSPGQIISVPVKVGSPPE